MADHKLILSSTTPDGLDASKTIAVNPDASNELLKTFGQMLNNMTDNTYGKTDRIIKVNCDTEAGGGSQTATITLATESATLADVKAALKNVDRFYSFIASYDGDGQLYAFVESRSNPDDNQYIGVSPYVLLDHNTYGFCLFARGRDALIDELTAPITVKIRADATDNYKAAEATFTITA